MERFKEMDISFLYDEFYEFFYGTGTEEEVAKITGECQDLTTSSFQDWFFVPTENGTFPTLEENYGTADEAGFFASLHAYFARLDPKKIIDAQAYFDAAQIGDNETESVTETRDQTDTLKGTTTTTDQTQTRFDPINTESARTSGRTDGRGQNTTDTTNTGNGTTTRKTSRDYARDAGESARRNAQSTPPIRDFVNHFAAFLLSPWEAAEYYEE